MHYKMLQKELYHNNHMCLTMRETFLDYLYVSVCSMVEQIQSSTGPQPAIKYQSGLEIEHDACICHSIRGSLGILASTNIRNRQLTNTRHNAIKTKQQFLAQQVVIQIDLMKSQNLQNKRNRVYNKLKYQNAKTNPTIHYLRSTLSSSQS